MSLLARRYAAGLVLLALLVTRAVPGGPLASVTGQEQARNVLIIVADDLGVDAVARYGVATDTARTPTLDALADDGVLFEQAWAYPVCAPFRASVLTGRFGFRNGVGTVPGRLDLRETIIPKVLSAHPALGVAHAAIGKWHLGGGDSAPNDHGFGYHAGPIDNVDDYFAYQRVVNGRSALETGYATSVQVNDASAWIAERGAQPWFMWLAFNAPHEPFHRPPDDLHSVNLPPGEPGRGRAVVPFFQAAVEAMDTEIGRLLDEMDPAVRARTTIVFVGDNGSPARTVNPPFTRESAKGTLYQGGILTPLIIAGAGIEARGRRVAHLVHSVDLMATSLDLLGLPVGDWPTDIDGRSLRPFLESPDAPALRDWAFSERFGSRMGAESDGKAIRDLRYKYIRFDSGAEALYDLQRDPYEARELIAAGLDADGDAALAALRARLDALLAGPPVTPTPNGAPTVAATVTAVATPPAPRATATPEIPAGGPLYVPVARGDG